MLRTATRRFRAADIVHNTIMQEGRGRGAARGSGRGGREGRKQQHMSSTTSSSDISIKNGTGSNNQRRQNQKPGRGSGSNRSNNTRATPNQHTSNNKPINIETTNFQSIFHNKLCRGAAKYKVHAPQCSCPKVVKLRQRYKNTQTKVNSNETAVATINTTGGGYSNDQIQFDIDGNITHQLSQLDITSPNSNNDSNSPFDSLIVLPDTKGSNPSIYSCTNTNLQSFQKDGISCEQKLAKEIFGNTSTTTDKAPSSDNKKIPPFKVNCAICLLTTHQRNGFVAIISNSYNELQSTITSARKSTLIKQSNGKKLHADHAHFICAIKLSSLYSLLSAGKTRSKNEMVTKDILMQIRNDGGVDCLSSEMTNESTSSVQIKMGHHLTSLLWLLQDDKQKSSNNNVKYIMTMGYIDSSHAIELDLPGGKRHLGETTLQGVIREVEEECSLQIGYDWLVGNVSRRYGGSRDTGEGDGSIRVLEPRKVKGSVSGDAFFVMTPPPTM